MANYAKSVSKFYDHDITKKVNKYANKKTNSTIKSFNKAADNFDNSKIRKTIVRSVDNLQQTTKNLAKQSAIVISQTNNLFKQSISNLNNVSLGTLKLAKDSITDVTKSMTEEIHVKKTDTMMLSMAQISPLIGYAVKKAADSGVYDRFKNFASEKFDAIKSSINDSKNIKDIADDDDFLPRSMSANIEKKAKKHKTKSKTKDFPTNIISAKIKKKAKKHKTKSKTKDFPTNKISANIEKKVKKHKTKSKNVKEISIKKGMPANELLALHSIDKKLANIYKVLQTGITVDEVKKTEKLNKFPKNNKEPWKASLKSLLFAWQRKNTLESLNVDDSSFFQSRFAKDEKKKGLMASTVRAYRIATDESTLSVQEKMLKALLDMKKSLAGNESVWKMVADRLVIEHVWLRNLLWGFKKFSNFIKTISGYKLYKWATKSRGGYVAKLPKGLGSMEHTAAVLDMIYTDSMWRLDNIVFQLKQQYTLWSSYIHSTTGAESSEPTDISKGNWSFLPSISTLMSRFFRNRKNKREVPEYKNYVVTTNDLLQKQINIGYTQVNLLSQIADYVCTTALYVGEFAKKYGVGLDIKTKDRRKKLYEYNKKKSKVKETYADKRLKEDKYWNSSEEKLDEWRTQKFYEKKLDSKHGKIREKIKDVKNKIREKEIRYNANKAYKFDKKTGLIKQRTRNLELQLAKENLENIFKLRTIKRKYDASYLKRAVDGEWETNKQLGIRAWNKSKQFTKDIWQKSKTKHGRDEIKNSAIDKLNQIKQGAKSKITAYNNNINALKGKDKSSITLKERMILKLDNLVRQGNTSIRQRYSTFKLALKNNIMFQKTMSVFKKLGGGFWNIIKKGAILIGGFLKNIFSNSILPVITAGLGMGYGGLKWAATKAATHLGFESVGGALAGGAKWVGGKLASGAAKFVNFASASPGLAGGAVAGVKGLYDAYQATKKAKEWKTSKTSAAIGGFLGGATEGGTGSAINGAMKGAGIGMMFGPIGALIGAAIGGIAGAIGGKNLSKVIDVLLSPLVKIKDLAVKYIVDPVIAVFKWVGKTVWGTLKFMWNLFAHPFDTLGNIKQKINNWIVEKHPLAARLFGIKKTENPEDNKNKNIEEKAKEAAKKEESKNKSKGWFASLGSFWGSSEAAQTAKSSIKKIEKTKNKIKEKDKKDKNLLDKASDWYHSDSVQDKIKTAKDKATQLYAVTKSKLSNKNYNKAAGADAGYSTNKISDKISDFSKTAKDKATQLYALSKAKLSNKNYNKAAGADAGYSNQSFSNRISNTVNSFMDKHSTIKEGASNISGVLGNVKSSIANQSPSLMQNISSAVSKAGNFVWNTGKNVYENFITNIPTLNAAFVQLGKTIQEIISTFQNKSRLFLEDHGMLSKKDYSMQSDLDMMYKEKMPLDMRLKLLMGKSKDNALSLLKSGTNTGRNFLEDHGMLSKKDYSMQSNLDMMYKEKMPAKGIKDRISEKIDSFIDKYKDARKFSESVLQRKGILLGPSGKSDMGGIGDEISRLESKKKSSHGILSMIDKITDMIPPIRLAKGLYSKIHSHFTDNKQKKSSDIKEKFKSQKQKVKEISIPKSISQIEDSDNIFEKLGIKKIKGFIYTKDMLENLDDFDIDIEDNVDGINKLSPFNKSLYLYLKSKYWGGIIKPSEFAEKMRDKEKAKRIVRAAYHGYNSRLFYNSRSSISERSIRGYEQMMNRKYDTKEFDDSNIIESILKGKGAKSELETRKNQKKTIMFKHGKEINEKNKEKPDLLHKIKTMYVMQGDRISSALSSLNTKDNSYDFIKKFKQKDQYKETPPIDMIANYIDFSKLPDFEKFKNKMLDKYNQKKNIKSKFPTIESIEGNKNKLSEFINSIYELQSDKRYLFDLQFVDQRLNNILYNYGEKPENLNILQKLLLTRKILKSSPNKKLSKLLLSSNDILTSQVQTKLAKWKLNQRLSSLRNKSSNKSTPSQQIIQDKKSLKTGNSPLKVSKDIGINDSEEISISSSVEKYEQPDNNIFKKLGIKKIKELSYNNDILRHLSYYNNDVLGNKDGINKLNPFRKSLYLYLKAKFGPAFIFKPKTFDERMNDTNIAPSIIEAAFKDSISPILLKDRLRNDIRFLDYFSNSNKINKADNKNASKIIKSLKFNNKPKIKKDNSGLTLKGTLQYQGKHHNVSIEHYEGKASDYADVFTRLGISKIKGLHYNDNILDNLETYDIDVELNNQGINNLNKLDKSLYLYLNSRYYNKLIPPKEFAKRMKDPETAAKIFRAARHRYRSLLFLNSNKMSPSDVTEIKQTEGLLDNQFKPHKTTISDSINSKPILSGKDIAKTQVQQKNSEMENLSGKITNNLNDHTNKIENSTQKMANIVAQSNNQMTKIITNNSNIVNQTSNGGGGNGGREENIKYDPNIENILLCNLA